MKPRLTAFLLRISDDKSGEAQGIARQEQDGRGLADRLGWEIGPAATHLVIENDTSAFKRKKVRLPDGREAMRVVRPEFRRLLDMLDSGEADGLIAYDLDRVARDPRDLEDLIDVVERRHIPVESVTGSLRLASDADITMARVMVAVANKSSRDTSRRVARKHEQLAEEGKPGGGGIRPFGFETDRVTVRDAEATEIRHMAAMILDGASLEAVSRDLNARGVKPVRAKVWGNRSVWSVLTSPRNAGLRTFRGEVVGPAAWPAILDMDTWEQVRSTISDRARGGNNKLRFWLTGVMWCQPCGGRLVGIVGSPKYRQPDHYWCSTVYGGCGKISVGARNSEDEVERRILEFLGEPENIGVLRSVLDAKEGQDLRDQIAEDEGQLRELAGLWAAKRITLGEWMTARKQVEERLREARMLTTAGLPRVLRELLSGDLAAGWVRLEPADRRDVALLIVPHGFEVLPYPGSGSKFWPDRIRVRQPAV